MLDALLITAAGLEQAAVETAAEAMDGIAAGPGAEAMEEAVREVGEAPFDEAAEGLRTGRPAAEKLGDREFADLFYEGTDRLGPDRRMPGSMLGEDAAPGAEELAGGGEGRFRFYIPHSYSAAFAQGEKILSDTYQSMAESKWEEALNAGSLEETVAARSRRRAASRRRGRPCRRISEILKICFR